MSDLFRTVRRMFGRDPALAVTAIGVLGLAAGACTTVFTALDAVLLNPLPFHNPGRLVLVWSSHPNNLRAQTSITEFTDWRARNRVFEDMAAVAREFPNLIGVGEPERLNGQDVTTNFFDLIGTSMAFGRPFTPEDATGTVPDVAILGYSLWQRRFGSDPHVVGSHVTLDGRPFTIVGVASPDLLFPEAIDVWTPIMASKRESTRRSERFQVIGRLRPSVSLRQAEADMKAVAKTLEQEYPATNTNWTIALTRLDRYIAGDVGFATLLLFGSVILVLLIACANVANLLLARSASRRTEIAVRMAIGATRSWLMREFLIESAIVSVPAVVLGVLIAAAGSRAIAALPIPHAVRLHNAGLDLTVFGWSALLAVLTTVLFGLVPFVAASKVDIHQSLKEAGRTSTGSVTRSFIRHGLVIGEFALSMILLAGAGLLIRTFVNLQRVDLGFRPSNVLSLRYIRTSEDSTKFFAELLERIRQLPGVKSAGVASSVPLAGQNDTSDFEIIGRPGPRNGELWTAGIATASSSYFETMGVPLLEGRHFTDQDDRVALINEAMMRRFFPTATQSGSV